MRAFSKHKILAAAFSVVLACALTWGASPATWASGGSVSLGANNLSTEWYFAEGCTRDHFTTYIVVMNPNSSEAALTFTYMLGAGDPVVRQHAAAPASRFTVDISQDVGGGKDVSTSVHSTLPVAAERPMYFTYYSRHGGVYADLDGGHVSKGATRASTEWYFAEGTTRHSFITYLTIMNANKSAVQVDLTYYLDSGEPLSVAHTVAPHSRFTLDIAQDLFEHTRYYALDESFYLKSSLPVVAERPMYFDYNSRWDGGHVSLGANALGTSWHFAEGTTREGFKTYLCLMNPGGSYGTADITYMLGSGQVIRKQHELPARNRFTVDVSDDVGAGQDFSTSIATSLPVVAERPMYFDYNSRWDGGHDSLGSTALDDEWFFAEGTTRPGYVTYLTIMNPNDAPSEMRFIYLFASGGPVERTHEVAPHTRFTLDVAADVGPGQDFSAHLDSDLPIVAERPVYFGMMPKGITICIDPGHSGRDGSEIDPATGLNVGDNTGASNGSWTERQGNWRDSLRVKALLEEDGYDVRLTKQCVDDYVSLRQRADIGNTCALMVSMHYDPSGFTGVMRAPLNASRCPASDPGRITVVDPGVALESDRLARAIAPKMGLEVKDDTGGTSRGNDTPAGHPTCLIGSVLSRVPVVCIERMAWCSIPEAGDLSEERYFKGLVRGIDEYLGQPTF